MTERDPEKSGLVTIFHPWESGRDDSPIWDDALARVKITVMPKFERLDVKAASSSERPSDEEYNKFIFLVDTMKLYNYDGKIMYEKYPFKIKDVLFSSILYVANWTLLQIAKLIGEDSEEISHNLVQNAEYCESRSIIIEPLIKYFMPKFSSVEVTEFLPSLLLANNYCNGSLTFSVLL
jgi:hypothetical protein